MEKYILAVSLEVEVRVDRDPRDVAEDVALVVKQNSVYTLKEVRYTIRSGKHEPPAGELKAPQKGVIEGLG